MPTGKCENDMWKLCVSQSRRQIDERCKFDGTLDSRFSATDFIWTCRAFCMFVSELLVSVV